MVQIGSPALEMIKVKNVRKERRKKEGDRAQALSLLMNSRAFCPMSPFKIAEATATAEAPAESISGTLSRVIPPMAATGIFTVLHMFERADRPFPGPAS